MSGLLTVHLRVNDSATGKPTAVRLCIKGPHGEYFAPFGRFVDFPTGRNEAVGGQVVLGSNRHYYIDGACEIRLPTGVPLQVEITKGLELKPIRATVTLGAGQLALRFSIERWINLRLEGWHSGDSRVHFLSPHAALLEAQAEGVAIVHLLATVQDVPGQDGKLYPSAANIEAFSGTEAALERAGHFVCVNTFNTHAVLGRLALLNCHRIVYPLAIGGRDATDDWSLADWCDQSHRKKGLVAWADAFRQETGLVGGEALIALILGKIDALEIDARERAQPLLPVWYRLLDAGFRLPVVACSAKDSNRVALGSVRTYAQLAQGEPLSCGAWIEAVRLGRTFVTNGPLLRLSVNGNPPGSMVELPANEAPLQIEAQAHSSESCERLAIIANGEIIAETRANEFTDSARLAVEHRLPDGGWIAARSFGGKAYLYPYPNAPLFAHTSPVFVHVPGRAPPRRAAARDWLRPFIQQTRDWIDNEGRFANPRSKEHLLRLADDALAALGASGAAPD